MASSKKISSVLIVIVIWLVILISSGGIYTIYVTHTIKSDAEIINKLGIIRGSIQRSVKLEVGEIEDDELINTIDLKINEFKDKEIKIYDKNDEIEYAVDNLYPSWIQLKKLIYEFRENPSNQSRKALLEKSEEVWRKSNSMVLVSQIVYERKITNYRISFMFLAINLTLGILIIFFIKRHVQGTLEHLINYDGLTKVHNRRYFNEYLDKEILRSERYNRNLTLIMLDIDHFKKVNDTFGHDVGDSVLKELSSLIKGNIRKCDIFARIGGEEFAIIATETGADSALVLSENIRKTVEEYDFKFAGKITISLGITQFVTGDNPDSIFKRADTALYKSKNQGRNRSEIVNQKVKQRI